MSLARWAGYPALGILLCAVLTGCFPVSDSQSDDTKEPNFIHGKNLAIEMDYQGAADSFDKALEVNARSAPAHFELAWLCEEKLNDPAAAIYHYTQYLKYSASPDKADVVKQHINSCKLELARNVSAISSLAPAQQREFDRVLAENKNLLAQVVDLQSQLSQLRALPTARNPATPAANTPGQDATETPQPSRTVTPPPHLLANPAENAARNAAYMAERRFANVASNRTYIVKPGDTMAGIARKSKISLNELTAANPQVKPTHLKVGQALNLPNQ